MHKIGRNDTCHCGSGKKYKRCHLSEDGVLQFGAKLVQKLLPEAAGLVRFDQFFPETADSEGRAIWVFGKDPRKHGPFFFMEFYCAQPTCDCNRVMIGIIDLDQVKAGTLVSVSYAFDRNDPEPGPYIDPLNPITPIGRQLYPLVEKMLLQDLPYVERLKKHYAMVKAKTAQGRTERVH